MNVVCATFQVERSSVNLATWREMRSLSHHNQEICWKPKIPKDTVLVHINTVPTPFMMKLCLFYADYVFQFKAKNSWTKELSTFWEQPVLLIFNDLFRIRIRYDFLRVLETLLDITGSDSNYLKHVRKLYNKLLSL